MVLNGRAVGSKNVYKDAHNTSKIWCPLLIYRLSAVEHFLIPSTLLTMQLTLPSVTLLLAAVVSAASVHSARQSCPEAARFGEVSITPSTVSPGDVRASPLPTV